MCGNNGNAVASTPAQKIFYVKMMKSAEGRKMHFPYDRVIVKVMTDAEARKPHFPFEILL